MTPRATSVDHPVPPALRPHISTISGYELRGFPPGVHIGVPSTTLTLVIDLEDGVHVSRLPRPDRTPQRFAALVGGLHDRPVHIAHDGTQVGVQLALTPRGARALLGVPAAALAAEVVDVADLLGPVGRRLRERVGDARTWSARMQRLVGGLHDLLAADRPGPSPTAAAAWALLTGPRTVAVADVADELGYSRRRLGAIVRGEFGLPPKVIASTARFERASALLRQQPGRRLADVAAATGHADQSHLVREWRRFTGVPPSTWLREEVFPFIQADGVRPPA